MSKNQKSKDRLAVINQHIAALSRLLQDEPEEAVQYTTDRFAREVKYWWDARRRAGKPTRETRSQ